MTIGSRCNLWHLTVKVFLSQPCFELFFRGHDEAGLLAFEALRGSPRPAQGQLWHYTAGFCVQTLAGVFQKETWPPHSLNPTVAEAVRWRLFVKYLPRRSCEVAMFACQKCPCQGLHCVVAMLRLPAFKLSRLSSEVAMFVCQVPQLSGFKLWGGHVCLQYLPQVEMCGCLLLKCCACTGLSCDVAMFASEILCLRWGC